MPSPTRDSIPTLAPHLVTEISAPPSPRTHRALRKLQSAHNLGAAARSTAQISQPSLISQQRLLHQERNVSPTRRQASTRSPQRNRANSDAASPGNLQPAISLNRKRSALSRTSAAADGMSLERLIRDGPPDGDVRGALESTRLKVLDQGIKADTDGMSSVRIYVWLILLDAPVMGTDEYLSLIHRGASPAYSKIRNDTFRTLTTDPLFRRRVSEASLIRLLNAIAWKMHDSREFPHRHLHDVGLVAGGGGRTSRSRALTLTDSSETSVAEYSSGTYVQGMNVLAAPFLYAARSEAEAFVAFDRLLTKECPAYIRGAMVGVHKGLALVDKVLAIVDARLHIYLVSKGLSAEIYAFPSVLTLCACTPPLPEVLRLWDFLFAYGPHLNILCIVAQLIMMRNELLGSNNPNKLLRSFPSLHADQIKRTALAIVKMIPDDIYAEIVTHAL
ncbi:cell cycle arrest BUB2 [Apiospora phragmitis]|uniref:Cell cycle arrest BUB2 n=1 Tax=Apiospora phragmitis TaxID=2905665 RepID=A0ABR1TSW6_9PEZI